MTIEAFQGGEGYYVWRCRAWLRKPSGSPLIELTCRRLHALCCKPTVLFCTSPPSLVLDDRFDSLPDECVVLEDVLLGVWDAPLETGRRVAFDAGEHLTLRYDFSAENAFVDLFAAEDDFVLLADQGFTLLKLYLLSVFQRPVDWDANVFL